MKIFLLKIATYTFLALIFFNALAWCSLYILKNSSFYKPEFVTHEVKKSRFDYIVIGSSIGLTALNTTQIDNTLKTTGLNLSIDDTSLNSAYLMLEHFYHQNKKANYCVLAINFWDVSNEAPKLSDNDYRFLPYVNEKYVSNYYSEMETGYFKPLTWSKYMPFIGVGYYNTELVYPSILAVFKPNMKNRFDENGNYSYPYSGDLKPIKKQRTILQWKNPFLFRIQQLCNNNNTKLIIYQAPNFNTTIQSSTSSFIFVNHSDGLTQANCFYDAVHINATGRKLESAAFSSDLKQIMIKK